MKKFLLNKFFLISAASVVVIVAAIIIGMSVFKKASVYQLALDNLAEARFYMKQDESTQMRVQFFSGMREEPYTVNGTAEQTTAFAIINVDPKDSSLASQTEISGTIKIGDELLPITLEKNPYDKNFATDIGRLIEADKEIVVVLNLGQDNAPSFTLRSAMPEGSISWEEALRIATEELSSELADAGKFECYVKIIQDQTKTANHVYWYIQFIGSDGNTMFCVVDPSGNIVGKK